MTNNIFYSALKFILVDLIFDILLWPVWWYSKGLVKTGLFCLQEIKNQEERLGLLIWIRNIFTPMFGQYDFEGRLISFFVRLIQVIVRFILLLIWAALMLVIFLAWIILPVLAIYQLINNFLWLFG